MKKNKTGKIIGIVIIFACLGYAMFLAKSSLVTNVPFAEAATATDATVQIMGAPVPGTMAYDPEEHLLHFSIKDSSGSVMPVQFAGPKPEDLDTAMVKATKIGAQGTYSRAKGVFVAENLVVKCPSKYDVSKTEDHTYGKV